MLCAAAFVAFGLGAISRADSVSVRLPDEPPTNAPTVYADVKINGIENGRISFTTAEGNNVDKDLPSVAQMTIDDEPAFNQAQADYSAKHYDHAADEFDQTIQNTAKPWLRAYCEPLLTSAADKAGRFDKALEGYVWLVINAPDQASNHQPAVPSPGNQYLDGAASTLNSAVEAPGIAPAQQSALLAMLLEVNRARKDMAAMDQVATRLIKLQPDPDDPGAKRARLALADARLSEAGDALDRKNFDGAANILDGARSLFVDPPHQADALYILAEARQGQANSKNEPDAWRDAAIAYMRVVAHFKDAAGAPHVADSLLKTAQILQGPLNKPDKALQMYQSIQTDYPNSGAAREAAKQIARLQAAGVRPG